MADTSDSGFDDLDMGATLRGFGPGQQLFGRYRLKRIIGLGGMGVVWLACDETLNRDVALKLLPDTLAHSAEAIAELKRETARALDLTHPNIVRIYHFEQETNVVGISMEYVDGET